MHAIETDGKHTRTAHTLSLSLLPDSEQHTQMILNMPARKQLDLYNLREGLPSASRELSEGGGLVCG